MRGDPGGGPSLLKMLLPLLPLLLSPPRPLTLMEEGLPLPLLLLLLWPLRLPLLWLLLLLLLMLRASLSALAFGFELDVRPAKVFSELDLER